MVGIHPIRIGYICLFCILFGFFGNNAWAEDDLYVPRSYLEVVPEMRLITFERDNQHSVQTLDMVVNFGLDWKRWRYVSIHGWLQAGFIVGLDEKFEYRFMNRQLHSWLLALLGLQAVVDIHPANRIVALNFALRSDTAITQGRVGIFTVETGVGITARPVVRTGNYYCKTLSFGIMTWIPLLDKFETVFGLERKWFYLSLMAGFEF